MYGVTYVLLAILKVFHFQERKLKAFLTFKPAVLTPWLHPPPSTRLQVPPPALPTAHPGASLPSLHFPLHTLEPHSPSASRLCLLSCFPGGASGEDPACRCKSPERRRLDPWVGKIPWRRGWQSILVFLPGESRGQRTVASYGPYDHKESEIAKAT